MYTRKLKYPNHSFFLFGPRGTGKTTWLRQTFRDAHWFNLLRNQDLLPLLGDISLFRSSIEILPEDSWIIVDEVQKLPDLLNEIHDIISVYGDRYRFALSGSSARKLRRAGTNMLAGRVIERRFFPLTRVELGDEFNLDKTLEIGTLPDVYRKSEFAVDILETYARTYLQQEIQQEALVRNIGSFARFLKIAAIMNGQIVNVTGIARDAGVARTTVQGYFEILVDTLIGFWLPAWQPRAKVRERGKSKFYFFDTGVIRALSGRVRSSLSDLEIGSLLETYIFHEIRAAISLQNVGGELSYWRSAAGVEVDVVWTRGNYAVGIEIKSSKIWRRKSGKGVKTLLEQGFIDRGYVVYGGTRAFREGMVDILPVTDFLDLLESGKILTEP